MQAPKGSDPQLTTMRLTNHLKALRLPTMLREYQAVARECSDLNATYDAYLEELCERELNVREGKATTRRIQQAKFPVTKELVDYDFSAAPNVNKAKVLELARGQFVNSKTNVIFIGPPGVGKTHLAVALGHALCRVGKRVRFFTASGLVNTYLEARESLTVQRLEAGLQRCDLVIVDELGYLPLDTVGAEHLFSFFSQCYEQCSVMITTNLPFDEWPQTFAGEQRLTAALIDRLTHRVSIMEMPGESYRLKYSLRNHD